MKKLLSTAVSLLLAVVASATDVTLVRLDGTGLVRDLSLVGRFELLDGGACYQLVARGGSEVIASGSLASLARISFVDESVTIDNPTALDAFSLEGRNVKVCKGDASVRIFGLGGILVRSSEDGKVSVNGLPAGVYIVVSGGKAAKIVVK